MVFIGNRHYIRVVQVAYKRNLLDKKFPSALYVLARWEKKILTRRDATSIGEFWNTFVSWCAEEKLKQLFSEWYILNISIKSAVCLEQMQGYSINWSWFPTVTDIKRRYFLKQSSAYI